MREPFRPYLSPYDHMVFRLCFSWCICSILPPSLFSSGAIACSFILPWCWLSTWLYMTSGDQHLLWSGLPLCVFGSYSWETLISYWPSSRSWLGREVVQKYLNRGLGSPDLLSWKRVLQEAVNYESFMVWVVKFANVAEILPVEIYECACLLLTPCTGFPQKPCSRNPKIKKESVFHFDFKTGS